MSPAVLIVYSDYLCPWCHLAAHRVKRLEAEFGEALRVEWRTFLLRPRPGRRDLEKFRAYTESWRRPASEPDAPEFRVWTGEAGPPSHSVPPHLAAKAAERVGPDAFRDIHRRLLRAYFVENRDITARETLRALWSEARLPDARFLDVDDPELLRVTLAQHEEAIEAGVTGVPAAQLNGNPAVIVGAHPLDLYRRWIERARQGHV